MKLILKLLQIIVVSFATLWFCILLCFRFCSLFIFWQSGGIILPKILAICVLMILWGVLLIVANKIL